MFRLFGFADVDHQTAHHRFVAMFDQADNIPHPEGFAIGSDDAIVEAVVPA